MNTAEIVDDILIHYGKKGMRWGIRQHRERVQAGQAARKASLTKGGRSQFRLGLRPRDYGDVRRANKAANAAAKAVKERQKADRAKAKQLKSVRKSEDSFTKTLQSNSTKAMLHNSVVTTMNNHHIPRLNAKYAADYHAGHLSDPSHPSTKAYNNEFKKAYMGELRKHSATLTNREGTKSVKVIDRSKVAKPDEWMFELEEDIRHVDGNPTLTIKVIKDAQGWITGFELVNNSIAQGSLIVGDILIHHGVKGMRWGVRSRSSRSGAVTVKDRRKKVKTSGGKGLPAHPEAVRAHMIGQKARGSGVKALSNQELQDYTRRLNLEQQLKNLNTNSKSAGRKFISEVGGQVLKKTVKNVGSQYTTQQVKKKLKMND